MRWFSIEKLLTCRLQVDNIGLFVIALYLKVLKHEGYNFANSVSVDSLPIVFFFFFFFFFVFLFN